MTASTINKYKTYLYDENGKPVALQLDLKNKKFKDYIEEMIEDYEDTIVAMERENGETIDASLVEKRVLALQK